MPETARAVAVGMIWLLIRLASGAAAGNFTCARGRGSTSALSFWRDEALALANAECSYYKAGKHVMASRRWRSWVGVRAFFLPLLFYYSSFIITAPIA